MDITYRNCKCSTKGCTSSRIKCSSRETVAISTRRVFGLLCRGRENGVAEVGVESSDEGGVAYCGGGKGDSEATSEGGFDRVGENLLSGVRSRQSYL